MHCTDVYAVVERLGKGEEQGGREGGREGEKGECEKGERNPGTKYRMDTSNYSVHSILDLSSL